MARQPLDVREWLEDMRRYNSRDADRATELLDILDRVEGSSYDEELALTDIAERAGDAILETMGEVVGMVKTCRLFEQMADQHEMVKDIIGDTLARRIETALDQAVNRQEHLFALSELCMAAGIIAKNDYTTDPLPLLRMFLPVD